MPPAEDGLASQGVRTDDGPHAVLRVLGANDDSMLGALGSEVEWLSLPGGWVLFREGEGADALYVVVSGCLGVTVLDHHGSEIPVASIRGGETVGEMALLAGGARSATVSALRDTELLRLDRSSCERLFEQHPRSMLSLISLLVQRLSNTTHHTAPAARIRTLALVPTGPAIDHQWLSTRIADELAKTGRRVRLLNSDAAGGTTEWLNSVESEADLVVYCTDPEDSAWSMRCVRQADRLLLVASAKSTPQSPAWLEQLGPFVHPTIDLALLQEGEFPVPECGEHWRQKLPIDLLCHVRRGNPTDVGRLARLLTGKAIGLVLGGGGARGFAHLGVIRALREAHVPIDMVGGCSMGAIIGAGVALDWDEGEIRERLQHAFVVSNPVNDYTLPFLALARGHKVARRLAAHFGSVRIENLWRPYFCVSTNLTTGNLAVHRDGPLVHALRASVSIPGLLPPVLMDGEAHVDGGIINCLPVDLMRAMRRGPVIAVDVASDLALKPLGKGDEEPSIWKLLHECRKMPPIVDLLVRAGTVGSSALADQARHQANILFRPCLESVELLDWHACDHAIEIGYRHATEKLEKMGKSGLSSSW